MFLMFIFLLSSGAFPFCALRFFFIRLILFWITGVAGSVAVRIFRVFGGENYIRLLLLTAVLIPVPLLVRVLFGELRVFQRVYSCVCLCVWVSVSALTLCVGHWNRNGPGCGLAALTGESYHGTVR